MQRGYIWQRDWTPAVADAIREAGEHLDGVIILGAEIDWRNGAPQVVEANISWPDLRTMKKPCALALRIAPYPGPFASDDKSAQIITEEAASLLRTARSHGVEPSEFQVDYDCAQGRLKDYELWLQALAHVVHPTRLVITTLPAWLDETEFPVLVRLADSYVLQVHSVPKTSAGGPAALCDPALARKWVDKASSLGIPFSVALPTYWCLAGYDPAGKLVGVAMDSVQPSWPAGTRMLEFGPEADAMADLVRQWQTKRPPGLRELVWYRLPVATDLRNWRWLTLRSVMEGRHPTHHLEVMQEGLGPVDFSLANRGEAEEELDCDVVVRWNSGRLVACDALPGWSVAPRQEQAVFSTTDRYRLRLSPGANTSIGWLRLENGAILKPTLVTHEQESP